MAKVPWVPGCISALEAWVSYVPEYRKYPSARVLSVCQVPKSPQSAQVPECLKELEFSKIIEE